MLPAPVASGYRWTVRRWRQWERPALRDPHVVAVSLRRQGLRATSARITLILGLSELGHATPEQLHTALAPTHPGLNVSTVYRTLKSLTDVAHAHLTGSAPSYYLTDGTEHAHLVCQDCGTITPLRGEALQHFVAELATDPGFAITISPSRADATHAAPSPSATGTVHQQGDRHD